MRAFVRKYRGTSYRIRTCTETSKRNCVGQKMHGCGSPILSESANAAFRKGTNTEVNNTK